MKKFLVYLVVIVLVVSLGFTVFYFVRDNEVISISSASVYKDVGDKFALDVVHKNKKAGRSISVTSSDDDIVSGSYNSKTGQYNAEAKKGGVARINVRTDSVKFRNLWCDVIVGDGSVEAPFYISSAEQLQAIGMGGPAKDSNGNVIPGVYEGAKGYEKYRSDLCYKLIGNINVSQVGKGYWIPLRNFSGRFDGNGMTLSNVYIDAEGYNTDMANDPNRDVLFSSGDDAGLFANIMSSGVVYNLKVENFTAIGTYGKLGVIAGVNQGTIERIEVNNAYLSVKTTILGGLVGENNTDTVTQQTTDEEGNTTEYQDRDIARIDRCSVSNLVVGEKTNTDGSRSVLGAQGTIGGLVGINKGGTLVYSYVRGTAYFADDATSPIIYGGVVAENLAKENLPVVGAYVYPVQGANVKDCYSDIRTFLDTTNTDINTHSKFAGAIAINQDYSNGKYEKTGYTLVNNYILGVYYNIDNLNYAQEGKTKNFEGIASFKMDTSDVVYSDTKTIVYGYTPVDEMKIAENFVSHITKVIEFNEDGVSKGVIEKEVLWLFDTIWTMDSAHNDGLPYLNYQLIYVPDDFGSVGVPTISSTLDEFTYQVAVDYPVSILSGTNDKIYMTVGEVYQLQYSPAGIDLTWTSSDPSVVDVDTRGELTAIKKGTVTITAITKTGRSDSITVVVENIVYSFMNTPSNIKIQVGATYNLANIYVNPTPSSGSIVFTVANSSIASYSNKTLTGNAVGNTELTATFGASKVIIPVEVVPAVKTPINITATPSVVEGCYSVINKTGTITLSASESLNYDIANYAMNSVVALTIRGNVINYTIKGIGNETFKVKGTSANYEGEVDIFFNIYDDVILTANPSYVSGDYSNIRKTGTIQINNNLGKTFTYTATSGNSNVDVSISNSKLNYTIKGVVTTNVVVTINSTNYVGSITIPFNVYKTATPSMVLNYSRTSIFTGSTVTLRPVSGNYTLPITYTSNNSSVASVSNLGVVTGVSAGTAVITARSANGATATCSVSVQTLDTAKIQFTNNSAYTIEIQDTINLSNQITGNWDSLTWTSADPQIASVNNGVVTGVAVGQTNIIVTANKNNTSASVRATINVIAKNVTITLDPTSAMCEPGSSIKITANVSNSNKPVVWTYANNQYIDMTPSETDRTTEFFVVDGLNVLGNSITVTATIDSVSASMTVTIAKEGYVYDLQTLNAIRYNPSKSYVLVRDINVGNWTPIVDFSGSFVAQQNSQNGQYYSLSNIQVNGNYEFAGLFANIKSKGRVDYITIKNSTINATTGAGAIAGKLEDSASVGYCTVSNTTVNGGTYAGGIVGICKGYGNTISVCDVTDCDITATSNAKSSVGGIVGETASNVGYASVVRGAIKVNANAHGNVGGIAGTSSGKISYSTVNSTDIKSGNQGSDYAGGIVGKTTGSISIVVVKSGTKITGFNAGGIGGEINAPRTISLSFKEMKKGFRYSDLSSTLPTNYEVQKAAVKDGVTITGTNVGGLFSAITSGMVAASYTRANLVGNDKNSAVIAGFATTIVATGFTNEGGSGQVGIVINCYSACTFGGDTRKGGKFAISQSSVHNYEGTKKSETKPTGYVFNYVFDKTLASGTAYFASSKITNIFTGAVADYYGAGKTSAEMQTQSTYTDKGINVFKFDGGYPTLSSEVLARG